MHIYKKKKKRVNPTSQKISENHYTMAIASRKTQTSFKMDEN